MPNNFMSRILSLAFICLNLFFGRPVWAAPAVQIQSDNFTLAGEIEAAEAIDMISELERFRSALFEIHNIPASTPDQRVDMYIVSDPEIFKVLGLDENFVAIYQPTIAGPRAILNGNAMTERPDELRHSLRHEYVHHFNASHRREVTPRWIEEGLAEYYAGYEELSDGQYRIGIPNEMQTLVMTYPMEGWYPIESQIISFSKIEHGGFPSHLRPKEWLSRPDNNLFFYTQNWALVHYMQNQPGGMEKLNRIAEQSINLVGGNAYTAKDSKTPTYKEVVARHQTNLDDIEQILEQVLGRSIEDLKTILQNYATSDDMPIATYSPKAGRVPASVTAKNLSETEAAAAQYRLLSLTASSASINETMKDLRAQVESDPSLRGSLLVSDAAQQFMLGWAVKAREQIDLALTLDPNLPNGQLLQAHIHYQEFANGNYANGAKIRATLRPILAVYPDNADLLVKMALTGLEELDSPSPDVTQAIARINATKVIQRQPLTALPLANMYAAKEDYAQALYVVQRALPFTDKQYQLHSYINDLEEVMAHNAGLQQSP